MPTIIVCLDTSTSSLLPLRYACYKAKKIGFTVQILSVIESSYKNLLFVSKTVGKDRQMQVEKHLKKLIDQAYDEIGVIPSLSVREGEILAEIIKEINETPDCAMLVLGKAQKSLSDNMVLPRIANQIGNKIQVPVVVVPENLSEEYLKKLI